MSTDSLRFDDGKAPDALRTIGEVAKALNIRQHVLRYWEEQFPMLKPVKRSGGRRYYRPADIALIARIDRLVHREGYTLRGARMAIEGKPQSDAGSLEAGAPVAPAQTGAPAQLSMFDEDLAEVMNELRSIRQTLAKALAEA